jgi:hypothetical protein
VSSSNRHGAWTCAASPLPRFPSLTGRHQLPICDQQWASTHHRANARFRGRRSAPLDWATAVGAEPSAPSGTERPLQRLRNGPAYYQVGSIPDLTGKIGKPGSGCVSAVGCRRKIEMTPGAQSRNDTPPPAVRSSAGMARSERNLRLARCRHATSLESSPVDVEH